MDRAASIAAQRPPEKVVVTASVNHVAFNNTIPLGSIVKIEAKVSRAFRTSMEVYLDVWYTDNNFNPPIKANEAIFTFVAVDKKRIQPRYHSLNLKQLKRKKGLMVH